MITFILSIIAMVMTILMINAAFRLGNRIAVASETTALSMAALCEALTPEARQRADEALARLTREAKAPKGRKSDPFAYALLIVLSILGIGAFLLAVGHAHAGEREQTRVYDNRGYSVVPQGNGSTRYYDARGNSLGTSTTTGNTTNYYDARGNRTGSTVGPANAGRRR